MDIISENPEQAVREIITIAQTIGLKYTPQLKYGGNYYTFDKCDLVLENYNKGRTVKVGLITTNDNERKNIYRLNDVLKWEDSFMSPKLERFKFYAVGVEREHIIDVFRDACEIYKLNNK
jgi:hypothetical protein